MVLQCQLDKESIVNSNKVGATRRISKVAGVPIILLFLIILLNCDYRILTKILVKRMKPVLPLVIKSDQFCTVDKKNILYHIGI